MFSETRFKGSIVEDDYFLKLEFNSVKEALEFAEKNKFQDLIVESRTGLENPWSVTYGERVPYKDLTVGEKAIIGLIYKKYKEWAKNHSLKNSMFTDFVSDCIAFEDKDLRYYANYMYLCDYEAEMTTIKLDLNNFVNLVDKK